jgi:molecular chaperone DnaJ
MTKRDFYEVLGIDRNASQDEIKRAFKKKARQTHPDVNQDDPNAEEKFKEVQAAFEILHDPQKRQQYDNFGHAAFDRTAGMGGDPFGFSGFGGFGGGFGGSIMEDLLSEIFGGSRGRGQTRTRRPSRGDDLQLVVDLTMEEAFSGKKLNVQVPRTVTCDKCQGSGLKPGASRTTCRTCGGAGQVRRSAGPFSIAQPCPACRGEGSVISDPCTSCSGAGTITRTEKLEVGIPAGVDTGSRVRVSGKGNAGTQGGAPGDLYIITRLEKHPFLDRKGDNLYCSVPISYAEAALGTKIPIPTLEGPVEMKISPGTQPGAVQRVSRRGMPALRGRGRGDLFVEIKVEIPKNLTREERELLEKLRDIHTAKRK